MKHAKVDIKPDIQGSSKLAGFFLIVCLIALLVPFICAFFMPVDESKQTSELANFPTIQTNDGKINTNFLNELGDFFEDRFAFRNEVITANSFIKSALFGEPGSDQVIMGKDSYMFYAASVPDYTGKNALSDDQLDSIAANLKEMQSNIEANGKEFLFTISPNKNTLYPWLMPSNLIQSTEKHNAKRLETYLSAYGVNYLNMFDVFSEDYAESKEVRYLKYDSHWNNEGALLASNAILTGFGLDEIKPTNWKTSASTEADLAKMNFPAGGYSEEEKFALAYNDSEHLTGSNWQFTYGISVYDSSIVTSSNVEKNNGKKLYMFRDSFGNTLIPYLASAFNTSEYSKLVPYDTLSALNSGADVVVVERAERNLEFLAENSPTTLANEIQDFSPSGTSGKKIENLHVEKSGTLAKICGTIDSYSQGQCAVKLSYGNGKYSKSYTCIKHIEEDGKLTFELYLTESEAKKFGIEINDSGAKSKFELNVSIACGINPRYVNIGTGTIAP